MTEQKQILRKRILTLYKKPEMRSQEIERHYRIVLPVSEIEFLYDYIENEEKRSKKQP